MKLEFSVGRCVQLGSESRETANLRSHGLVLELLLVLIETHKALHNAEQDGALLLLLVVLRLPAELDGPRKVA